LQEETLRVAEALAGFRIAPICQVEGHFSPTHEEKLLGGGAKVNTLKAVQTNSLCFTTRVTQVSPIGGK